MSYSFNPFTGCLDDVGNGIAKDGTTTTTASIPFAEGASIAADKKLQFGSNSNNYLGFVSPDALLLNADQATTDLYIQGRTFQFAAPLAQFSTDVSGKLYFQGVGSQFDPSSGQQDIWGNTHFATNGADPASVTFENTLSSVTFQVRPTFASGGLVNTDQSFRFVDANKYIQRTAATPSLDIASNERVRLLGSLTDAAGAKTFQIVQNNAFSHTSTFANERRYLEIVDASGVALSVVPSAAPASVTGGKEACLRVRQISSATNGGTSGGFFAAFADNFGTGGSPALSQNFNCIAGIAGTGIPTTSGLNVAGLNFYLNCANPASGNWDSLNTVVVGLNTPASGNFNPTGRLPSCIFSQVTDSGANCAELVNAIFQTGSVGTYGVLTQVDGIQIRNQLGGNYSVTTEMTGLNAKTFDATYGGTTRGIFIKVPTFTGTFTNKWALVTQEDIQACEETKVLYDGNLTTKGDSYHQYLSSALQTYVDGANRVRTSASQHQVLAGGSSTYAKVGGVVSVNTSATGNVGTGEDDLHTYSVPADMLNANGDSVRFRFGGTFGATLNNKRLRVRFGSSLIFDTGALAITAATDWEIEGEIIRTGGATQKSVGTLRTSSSVLAAFCDYATPTETLSSANTLKVTGEATANNDIVCELSKIDFMPTN